MGRPREFDVQQAVEDAMQCFWRHGYECATLSTLENDLGLDKGSIYKAFTCKRSLFLTALDTYLAAGEQRMRQALDAGASPRDAIRRWVEAVAASCGPPCSGGTSGREDRSTDPPAPRSPTPQPATGPVGDDAAPGNHPAVGTGLGCLAVNAMVELGPKDPEVAERLAAHWRRAARRLTDIIAAGQAQGEIRPDLAAEDVAVLLCRLAAGIAVFARGTSTDQDRDEASPATMAHIMETLLEG